MSFQSEFQFKIKKMYTFYFKGNEIFFFVAYKSIFQRGFTFIKLRVQAFCSKQYIRQEIKSEIFFDKYFSSNFR